jgi:hypothetical protein
LFDELVEIRFQYLVNFNWREDDQNFSASELDRSAEIGDLIDLAVRPLIIVLVAHVPKKRPELPRGRPGQIGGNIDAEQSAGLIRFARRSLSIAGE